MSALDLKMPPLLVVAVIGGAMWWCAHVTPDLRFEYAGWWFAAGAVALLGCVVIVSALIEFRRHQTTVDPTRPEKSTAIVKTGIYRRTRNPMYLGMLLWLIAWGLVLSNPLTVLGPLAFVLYMNRFQIAPEERALAKAFGDPYDEYCRSVRRWI